MSGMLTGCRESRVVKMAELLGRRIRDGIDAVGLNF